MPSYRNLKPIYDGYYPEKLSKFMASKSSKSTLIGNTFSDERISWLACEEKLAFIDNANNSLMSCVNLNDFIQDGCLVKCGIELSYPSKENPLLLLGCQTTLGGMFIVYHPRIRRAYMAVEIDIAVSSMCVIEDGSNEETLLPDVLKFTNGVIALGGVDGSVILIDFSKHIIDKAIDGKFNGNHLNLSWPEKITKIRYLDINDSKVNIKYKSEVCNRNGDSLAFLLNDDNGELEAPRQGSACSGVTSLHYNYNIGALFVGFEVGIWYLWNLIDFSLIYKSGTEGSGMPIVGLSTLEPCDDPRHTIYLWVSHSSLASPPSLCQASLQSPNSSPQQASPPVNNDSPFSIMYTLYFNSKSHFESYGVLYKDFLQCSISHDLEMIKDQNNFISGRIISVKSVINSFWHSYICTLKEEEMEEVRVWCILWESETSDRGKECYVTLFDLNQWYKEQMPSEPPTNNNSLGISMVLKDTSYFSTSLIPVGEQSIVSLCITAESLSMFRSINSIDVHYYPSAISFRCVVVTNEGISQWKCSSIQEEILDNIAESPAAAMISPNSIVQLAHSAGLVPLYEDPNTTFTSHIMPEYCRCYLLTISLEYERPNVILDCARHWYDSACNDELCSLDFIINWLWDCLLIYKTKLDKLCIPLFDCSGVQIDLLDKKRIFQCGRIMKKINNIYRSLLSDYSTFKNIYTVKHRVEAISLILHYVSLVEWFVKKKILPEKNELSLPSSSLMYKYEEIKSNADSRRRTKELLIDKMMEHWLPGPVLREWQAEVRGSGAVYPPPSIQSLVRLTLIATLPLHIKHFIITYFLLDFTSTLPNDMPIIDEIGDYQYVFDVSKSCFRISHGYWNLDRNQFVEGVEYLLDSVVKKSDLSDWEHRHIINSLFSNKQYSLAFKYIKAKNPSLSLIEDIRLDMSVTIAVGNITNAFFATRQHSDSRPILLKHFFHECLYFNQIKNVYSLPLDKGEEEAFLEFLRSSKLRETNDLILYFYISRCRYTEAFALYDKMKASGLCGLDVNSRKRDLIMRGFQDSLGPILQIDRYFWEASNTKPPSQFTQKGWKPTSCFLKFDNSDPKNPVMKTTTKEYVSIAVWQAEKLSKMQKNKFVQNRDVKDVLSETVIAEPIRVKRKIKLEKEGTPAKKIKTSNVATPVKSPLDYGIIQEMASTPRVNQRKTPNMTPSSKPPSSILKIKCNRKDVMPPEDPQSTPRKTLTFSLPNEPDIRSSVRKLLLNEKFEEKFSFLETELDDSTETRNLQRDSTLIPLDNEFLHSNNTMDNLKESTQDTDISSIPASSSSFLPVRGVPYDATKNEKFTETTHSSPLNASNSPSVTSREFVDNEIVPNELNQEHLSQSKTQMMGTIYYKSNDKELTLENLNVPKMKDSFTDSPHRAVEIKSCTDTATDLIETETIFPDSTTLLNSGLKSPPEKMHLHDISYSVNKDLNFSGVALQDSTEINLVDEDLYNDIPCTVLSSKEKGLGNYENESCSNIQEEATPDFKNENVCFKFSSDRSNKIIEKTSELNKCEEKSELTLNDFMNIEKMCKETALNEEKGEEIKSVGEALDISESDEEFISEKIPDQPYFEGNKFPKHHSDVEICSESQGSFGVNSRENSESEKDALDDDNFKDDSTACSDSDGLYSDLDIHEGSEGSANSDDEVVCLESTSGEEEKEEYGNKSFENVSSCDSDQEDVIDEEHSTEECIIDVEDESLSRCSSISVQYATEGSLDSNEQIEDTGLDSIPVIQEKYDSKESVENDKELKKNNIEKESLNVEIIKGNNFCQVKQNEPLQETCTVQVVEEMCQKDTPDIDIETTSGVSETKVPTEEPVLQSFKEGVIEEISLVIAAEDIHEVTSPHFKDECKLKEKSESVNVQEDCNSVINDETTKSYTTEENIPQDHTSIKEETSETCLSFIQKDTSLNTTVAEKQDLVSESPICNVTDSKDNETNNDFFVEGNNKIILQKESQIAHEIPLEGNKSEMKNVNNSVDDGGSIHVNSQEENLGEQIVLNLKENKSLLSSDTESEYIIRGKEGICSKELATDIETNVSLQTSISVTKERDISLYSQTRGETEITTLSETNSENALNKSIPAASEIKINLEEESKINVFSLSSSVEEVGDSRITSSENSSHPQELDLVEERSVSKIALKETEKRFEKEDTDPVEFPYNLTTPYTEDYARSNSEKIFIPEANASFNKSDAELMIIDKKFSEKDSKRTLDLTSNCTKTYSAGMDAALINESAGNRSLTLPETEHWNKMLDTLVSIGNEVSMKVSKNQAIELVDQSIMTDFSTTELMPLNQLREISEDKRLTEQVKLPLVDKSMITDQGGLDKTIIGHSVYSKSVKEINFPPIIADDCEPVLEKGDKSEDAIKKYEHYNSEKHIGICETSEVENSTIKSEDTCPENVVNLPLSTTTENISEAAVSCEETVKETVLDIINQISPDAISVELVSSCGADTPQKKPVLILSNSNEANCNVSLLQSASVNVMDIAILKDSVSSIVECDSSSHEMDTFNEFLDTHVSVSCEISVRKSKSQRTQMVDQSIMTDLNKSDICPQLGDASNDKLNTKTLKLNLVDKSMITDKRGLDKTVTDDFVQTEHRRRSRRSSSLQPNILTSSKKFAPGIKFRSSNELHLSKDSDLSDICEKNIDVRATKHKGTISDKVDRKSNMVTVVSTSLTNLNTSHSGSVINKKRATSLQPFSMLRKEHDTGFTELDTLVFKDVGESEIEMKGFGNVTVGREVHQANRTKKHTEMVDKGTMTRHSFLSKNLERLFNYAFLEDNGSIKAQIEANKYAEHEENETKLCDKAEDQIMREDQNIELPKSMIKEKPNLVEKSMITDKRGLDETIGNIFVQTENKRRSRRSNSLQPEILSNVGKKDNEMNSKKAQDSTSGIHDYDKNINILPNTIKPKGRIIGKAMRRIKMSDVGVGGSASLNILENDVSNRKRRAASLQPFTWQQRECDDSSRFKLVIPLSKDRPKVEVEENFNRMRNESDELSKAQAETNLIKEKEINDNEEDKTVDDQHVRLTRSLRKKIQTESIIIEKEEPNLVDQNTITNKRDKAVAEYSAQAEHKRSRRSNSLQPEILSNVDKKDSKMNSNKAQDLTSEIHDYDKNINILPKTKPKGRIIRKAMRRIKMSDVGVCGSASLNILENDVSPRKKRAASLQPFTWQQRECDDSSRFKLEIPLSKDRPKVEVEEHFNRRLRNESDELSKAQAETNLKEKEVNDNEEDKTVDDQHVRLTRSLGKKIQTESISFNEKQEPNLVDQNMITDKRCLDKAVTEYSAQAEHKRRSRRSNSLQPEVLVEKKALSDKENKDLPLLQKDQLMDSSDGNEIVTEKIKPKGRIIRKVIRRSKLSDNDICKSSTSQSSFETFHLDSENSERKRRSTSLQPDIMKRLVTSDILEDASKFERISLNQENYDKGLENASLLPNKEKTAEIIRKSLRRSKINESDQSSSGYSNDKKNVSPEVNKVSQEMSPGRPSTESVETSPCSDNHQYKSARRKLPLLEEESKIATRRRESRLPRFSTLENIIEVSELEIPLLAIDSTVKQTIEGDKSEKRMQKDTEQLELASTSVKGRRRRTLSTSSEPGKKKGSNFEMLSISSLKNRPKSIHEGELTQTRYFLRNSPSVVEEHAASSDESPASSPLPNMADTTQAEMLDYSEERRLTRHQKAVLERSLVGTPSPLTNTPRRKRQSKSTPNPNELTPTRCSKRLIEKLKHVDSNQ